MVLYQELDGGTDPNVYRGKAGEEGKLDVGSFPSTEKAGDHRAGALEVHAEWPRWVVDLPHLLSPSGCPTRGKDMANVGIFWPMDPDRASLEELSKDEVWSYLGWAL